MNRALLFPLALVSLALTATVATLDAQEPTAPPIRVDVQEVMVPVTVRDAKGRFVSNLEKSDFKIYDQGKEQTLTYFSRDRSQPVVVGFLLDLSSASNIQWKDYRESAIDLVLTLLNGGYTYVNESLAQFSWVSCLKCLCEHVDTDVDKVSESNDLSRAKQIVEIGKVVIQRASRYSRTLEERLSCDRFDGRGVEHHGGDRRPD